MEKKIAERILDGLHAAREALVDIDYVPMNDVEKETYDRGMAALSLALVEYEGWLRLGPLGALLDGR